MDAWGLDAWGSDGLDAWGLDAWGSGGLDAWGLDAWGSDGLDEWGLDAWGSGGLDAWGLDAWGSDAWRLNACGMGSLWAKLWLQAIGKAAVVLRVGGEAEGMDGGCRNGGRLYGGIATLAGCSVKTCVTAASR
eukprot:291713-Chlamydomonas_euryale.AAC.6